MKPKPTSKNPEFAPPLNSRNHPKSRNPIEGEIRASPHQPTHDMGKDEPRYILAPMVMPVANHAAVRTPFDKANRPMMRNEPGRPGEFSTTGCCGTQHCGHFLDGSSLEDHGLSTIPRKSNHIYSHLVIHICQTTMIHCDFFHYITLQGINISHLGKRKIIFKMLFLVC